VLAADTGRLIANRALECFPAGSWLTAHPDGIHVALSMNVDEDDGRIYWGALRDGEIDLAWVDKDCVLHDIHPSGNAYLAGDRGRARLLAHRHGDGAILVDRHADETFNRDPSWFGWTAAT
jgi:hypothetical protein